MAKGVARWEYSGGETSRNQKKRQPAGILRVNTPRRLLNSNDRFSSNLIVNAENSQTSPAARTGKAHWLVSAIILVICVVVAVVLLLLPPAETEAQQRGGGPAPVLVETIQREKMAETLQALGTVYANEQASLSSKITERVTGIYFKDGQFVEKDTLLVQLNDEEQRAQLAEARAQLAEREQQASRIRSVEGSGALSRSAIDEELARLDIARARVDLIQATINDRRILAPFDGLVGLRRISIGEMVSPAEVLVSINDLTPVKVDFTVPERYIGRLSIGQTVEASSVAWPDRTFTGTLDSISPTIDPVTRAVQVRAFIDNEDHALRPGMLLLITISLGEENVLTVSESALVPLGNRQFLYRLTDEDIAERIEVTIGRRLPGKVEIRHGLSEGERVVTQGYRVRPGAPVKITTDDEVFQNQVIN